VIKSKKMKNNIFEAKYYHIQRNPSWVIGETYSYGQEYNNFTNHLYKNGTNCKCYNPCNGDSIDVNPLFLAKEVLRVSKGELKHNDLQNYFHYDPLQTLDIMQQTLNEYMKFTRETIFEKVRLDSFPDKPSRLNCIWLIEDDISTINYWWKTLQKKGQKLFQVKATGNIHVADQQYLDLSAEPLNDLIERAKKYWQSEQIQNPTFNECVFIGSLEVVAERNINDFK
jgi:hypothetical protein